MPPDPVVWGTVAGLRHRSKVQRRAVSGRQAHHPRWPPQTGSGRGYPSASLPVVWQARHSRRRKAQYLTIERTVFVELHRAHTRRDSLVAYRVFIESEQRGTISVGERLLIPIEAATSEIFLKTAWCRSQKLVISGEDNQTIRLECAPSGGAWTILFFLTFGMRHYIRLNRVN